jgi:Zn-dependent peptidase ImmA (M78 family)
MSEFQRAKASELSKKAISELAETVSDLTGYRKSKNITESVRKLGGEVLVRDFWDSGERTGSLTVSGIRDFCIYVPQHTSLERDRFTIAHELGHYVVHYLSSITNVASNNSGSPKMVADRYGSGRVEWEANWFAASFLMPASDFTAVFKKFEGATFRIAEEFFVSEQAAKVRARSLALL